MSETSEEYWDLYDGERRPLGRVVRRGKLPSDQGLYHVAVMIVTMNSRGRLLCTLRSPGKITSPNMWEITAGSAVAGEESPDAARRELFEETGIDAGGDLRYVMTVKEATAFMDCYFLRREVAIDDIILQEGETVRAKWVTRAEFENMIARGRVAFSVVRRYRQLFGFLMDEGFL